MIPSSTDCEETTVKSVLCALAEESTATTATHVCCPGSTGRSPAIMVRIIGNVGVLSRVIIGAFGPSEPTPTLVKDHEAA